MEGQTVAIVGGGPGGLTAAKNMRDENFEVTVFEKSGTIGGVWSFNSDPKVTTTLLSTVTNVTKYRNCFTDFPAPNDAPAYLSAPQFKDYVANYAKCFDLMRHVKLNSAVQRVIRNAQDTKWCVHVLVEGREEVFEFDKVLFCSGPNEIAVMPNLPGMELFKGRVLHAQAFKNPADFAGLNVLVVGLGNSAADVSTVLVGHAKNIYLAHRRGINLVPRKVNGKPLDLHITRRINEVKWLIAKIFPGISRYLNDVFIRYLTTSSFKLDDAWRIHPTPSSQNHQPTISDTLVENLAAGTINSVHGLRSFISADKVELDDDTQVQIDAVIYCTGYNPDWSLFPDHNPQVPRTADSRIPALARLYQNIIHPDFPDSIAFLTFFQITEGATTLLDLMSMSIAQIWAGHYTLPSKTAMESEIAAHHQWVTNLAVKYNDTVYNGIVDEGPWLHWLNDVADTGINETLGYGWRGWWFWVNNVRFCNMLMTGVSSAHLYRLFDGKRKKKGLGARKKWDGAREAIVMANENWKLV